MMHYIFAVLASARVAFGSTVEETRTDKNDRQIEHFKRDSLPGEPPMDPSESVIHKRAPSRREHAPIRHAPPAHVSYDEHFALMEQASRVRQVNRDLEARLTHVYQCNQGLQQHCAQLEHDNRGVVERLAHLESELHARNATISTLRVQEADLRNAHQFLTSEDRCSGADVISLVKALNHEIFQLASLVAEYLAGQIDQDGGHLVDASQSAKAVEWVKCYLGKDIAFELDRAKHNEDFTLLQLVLQMALCGISQFLIRSWGPSGLNRPLSAIYQGMRDGEPQSVFARWRALTHAQINHLLSTDESTAHLLQRDLEVSIVNVAITARFRAKKSHENLTTFLNNKLCPIEQLIRRIRDSIKFEFLSADLEPVFIPCQKLFDAQKMTNGFGDEPSGVVVCTTELGLKMSKKGVKNGVIESFLLLKPQVFLESSLKELVCGE